MPFENMSGDPEQEYLVDGMVEEITTAMSRLPRLVPRWGARNWPGTTRRGAGFSEHVRLSASRSPIGLASTEG